MDREQKLSEALRRLVQAVNRLGDPSKNGVSYFEESPIKDAECQRRWKELNDAGVQAVQALAN